MFSPMLKKLARLDPLSAAYGHDLDKFFAKNSQREKLSDYPLIRKRHAECHVDIG